ncbi:MAG: hypothetical protein ACYCSN_01105 [Acidobacteriaceae bacterium]
MSDYRWKHFVAMALIGDGVMAILRPEYDAQAWNVGPPGWKRLMRLLRKHPGLTRCLGVVEVAGGVWMALANEEKFHRFSPPPKEEDSPEIPDSEGAVPIR